jgi:hypothetical protein
MIKKSLLILLLASTAMATQDAKVALREIHKVGDESSYLYDMKYEVDSTTVKVSLTWKSEITKVEADGAYEARETVLEGLMNFNGEEQTMPASEPETKKYDKDGNEIKEKTDGDEPDDDLNPMSASFDFLDYEPKAPVKIGETWEGSSKIAKVTYTLVGAEKIGEIDCWKIGVKGTMSKEGTSGEGTGEVFLRKTDFSLEKGTINIENAKFDNEGQGGKLETKLTRKS